MKEATGELSMTAIVVVVIGILAVAMPPLVSAVMDNMERRTLCANAYGCEGTGKNITCSYTTDEDTCIDGGTPGENGVCSITCENPDFEEE